MILPSLLLGMEKKLANKALREPLLQLYNEEEDIELDDLEIEQTLEKYREEDIRHQENGSSEQKEMVPKEEEE